MLPGESAVKTFSRRTDYMPENSQVLSYSDGRKRAVFAGFFTLMPTVDSWVKFTSLTKVHKDPYCRCMRYHLTDLFSKKEFSKKLSKFI